MTDRWMLFLLCCVIFPAVVASLCSPLSSSVTPSLGEGPVTRQGPERFGRHADAIFTNSYRKVLGQISARKFLQTIMGKRLGERTWPPEANNMKRQSGIYADAYKQDLTTIERGWQMGISREMNA